MILGGRGPRAGRVQSFKPRLNLEFKTYPYFNVFTTLIMSFSVTDWFGKRTRTCLQSSWPRDATALKTIPVFRFIYKIEKKGSGVIRVV